MADQDFHNDHTEELNRKEHRRKNVGAKAVVLHGYIAGTDTYHPITAVDNGDGTYSISTPAGGGGGGSPAYIKLAGSDANERDSTYYGDGLTSGVMAVHERYFDGAAYNRTPASKTEVDKSTTTDVIYIGKAPIGTATSAAAWQIKKIDKTVPDNVTITYADSGAFTAVYDDRASEVYT